MANVLALHSVGSSLITYLRNTYPPRLSTDFPCTFTHISSGELNKLVDPSTTLTLYLYRVTFNEHLRNVARTAGSFEGEVPLALDLHYLLSVWTDNVSAEQTILTWAMRQLFLHPILDASSLSPEAGWGVGDVIQVIPAELSNEDVMRIWDTLEPKYRLSTSYVARVVRVDADFVEDSRPVVADRFIFEDFPGLVGAP